MFSSSARRKKKFPVPALIPGSAWAKLCLPSVKHQSSSKGFRAKHRSLAQAPGEPWSWGFSSLVPKSANQAWSSPAAEEERAVVFGDRTSSICPGLGGGKNSERLLSQGLELQHLGFADVLRRVVLLTGVPSSVSPAFLWDLRARDAVQQASETGLSALACSAAGGSSLAECGQRLGSPRAVPLGFCCL